MIRLRVVTPYGDSIDEEIQRVIVRGVEGDLAFMKSTAPLATPLSIGKLRVKDADGQIRIGNVNTGYVSMKNDIATVVTDSFEWEDQVDYKRAEEAKKRALERLEEAKKNENIDVKRAELALHRALNRLRKD